MSFAHYDDVYDICCYESTNLDTKKEQNNSDDNSNLNQDKAQK